MIPRLFIRFDSLDALMHISEITKAILSSSDGGGEEQEHPLMQSLPMPIRPKGLRTTSMPHPSVSHDGSGREAWQHEVKSDLSHIDEASPQALHPCLHPMPEPSSNNSRTYELSDSGKADESAAAHSSSPTVTYGFRPNHTWGPHSNAKPHLSFISYLAEEARPYEKEPQKDIVWGQTERDRVYQYLILVPYQLERLLQLGFVICVDTLLGAITLLPLRCLLSLTALFKGSGKSIPMGSTIRDQLGGGRIFDLLTLLILVAVTVSLKAIRPGFIYYWLKDITNEFLKMGVLSMVFDIFDRILSNFGVNVLEALSGTCTLYASRRIGLLPLACDTFVAYLLSLAHAFCLMCQALVVAVALNSRNGLIALLIASNLAETKSTVFKRFDVQRIRGLAFTDAIERFQLVCILSFVVVEDMSSAGTWLPSWLIVKESLRILLSEVGLLPKRKLKPATSSPHSTLSPSFSCRS
jgi:hypothetical protein